MILNDQDSFDNFSKTQLNRRRVPRATLWPVRACALAD